LDVHQDYHHAYDDDGYGILRMHICCNHLEPSHQEKQQLEFDQA
jgi:hypothetical protein